MINNRWTSNTIKVPHHNARQHEGPNVSHHITTKYNNHDKIPRRPSARTCITRKMGIKYCTPNWHYKEIKKIERNLDTRLTEIATNYSTQNSASHLQPSCVFKWTTWMWPTQVETCRNFM
jgi:hypothetical protein